MRHGTTWTVMSAIALTAACRPELGVPIYQDADDFGALDASPPEPSVGSDPFEQGEERLSLGVFYEGGFSEEVPIDDATTHFYIFGLESDGTPTFTMKPETEIVEEGLKSERITHNGTPWWGGGVQWDTSRDLSKWSTLHLSLRSQDAAFELVQLHVVADEVEAIVETADYGYVDDGAWHHLVLPLEDFEGVDWTQVTSPLIFIGGGGSDEERLYVDNVFYAQD